MVHNCSAIPLENSICADEMAEACMARLLIWGLLCPNCAVRAHNALIAIQGVVSADVDWQRGLALVDYLPAQTNPRALVSAIGRAGSDPDHDFHAAVIE